MTKKRKTPRRIAFAMTKGGAGKTTSAAAFATELAARGYKVLLVDTDAQALVRHALGAMDSTFGLWDLADGEPYENVVYRFTDRNDSPKQRPGLDLIVAHGNLSKLTLAWTLTEEDREGQFTDLMTEIEDQTEYDYILVDCSPTDGIMNKNVLYYVHEIFLPVALSTFHVKGLDDFLDIVDETKKKKSKRKDSELEVKYVLPTRMNKSKRATEVLYDQVKEIVQMRLPKAKLLEPIPECARTDECAIYGQSIVEYEKNSRGGKAYIKAIEEVIKDAGKQEKGFNERAVGQ
jgi:chromosome partitioning protein